MNDEISILDMNFNLTKGDLRMKTLNGIVFLETKDIRESLKIGNQTCLELFRKKDFPAKKIGKSWLVMEESFKEYFKNAQTNE